MMLIPRRNSFDLFEDVFGDSFFKEHESQFMKTDIREKDDKYLIDIDLPGYEKENIKIMVEDGYLTIQATMNTENEEEDKGKFVRKERYTGTCSRSFYVGEEVKGDDIKASFKKGILTLEVPKFDEKQKLPEKEYIEIKED